MKDSCQGCNIEMRMRRNNLTKFQFSVSLDGLSLAKPEMSPSQNLTCSSFHTASKLT